MPTLETLNRQIVEMNSYRKHFDRTPEELASQVLEEAHELADGIQEAMVTDNVFEVASEIADLYILLAQLSDQLGINPAQAVQMKVLRNEKKYGDYSGNNGYSKGEYIRMSKEVWEKMGGDSSFSFIYLDILATCDEE